MQNLWLDYTCSLHHCLQSIEITEQNSMQFIDVNTGFNLWVKYTNKAKKDGKSCFLIGNGASASMASHFAADLSKNALVRAHVFTDMSQLTAIANDISFEQIYATPLKHYSQAEDLLIAISSSGASPNILAAIAAARQKKLMIITLSGFQRSNPLRQLGDLNLYVPTTSYGQTESCHAAILHFWLDRLTSRVIHE